MYNQCFNCGALWSIGSEEYDAQACAACGWMPGDPTDDDIRECFDDDDDDDDDNA